MTNDKYPIRKGSESKRELKIRGLRGLRKGVTIGTNSTILPGIEIGEGSQSLKFCICVDRSLVPMWERKPLLEQLHELYDWYYKVK